MIRMAVLGSPCQGIDCWFLRQTVAIYTDGKECQQSKVDIVQFTTVSTYRNQIHLYSMYQTEFSSNQNFSSIAMQDARNHAVAVCNESFFWSRVSG
ncbi:hypothetical protein ACFX2A_010491 [Malus domestica]